MIVSNDVDDGVLKTLQQVCQDLNMDRQSSADALQAYEAISRNFALEGDCRHWLACALYVACRIGSSTGYSMSGSSSSIQSNMVSLRSLLSACSLDLSEFLRKMDAWANMANLDTLIRRRLTTLTRSFDVTKLVFGKFEKIVKKVFAKPKNGAQQAERNAVMAGKRHKGPTNVFDIHRLTWLIYVLLKRQVNTEIVNCFHLLLCCLDFVYISVIRGKMTDLLDQDFYQEQLGKCEADGVALHDIGILRTLCEEERGMFSEANVLRIYFLHQPLKKLISDGDIKGFLEPLYLSLDSKDLEVTIKSLKQRYELSVLQAGELDEQVFLNSDASSLIGATPEKLSEAEAHDQMCKHILEHVKRSKSSSMSIGAETPLSGRGLLPAKAFADDLSPVSTATLGASKLHALLNGRTSTPSEKLTSMFQEIIPNPQEQIESTIEEMGQVFCKAYAKKDATSDDDIDFYDFAKRRLQLGQALFYKVLEAIIVYEHGPKNPLNNFSLPLRQENLLRPLFASCLETVMFCFNSEQTLFPWILDVFGITAFNYLRIIELFVRAEQQLSREAVKHFNSIEEHILESLIWRSESPVWEILKKRLAPSAQQVSLFSQDSQGNSTFQVPTTPGKFASPAPGSVARRKLFSLEGENQPARRLVLSSNGSLIEVISQNQDDGASSSDLSSASGSTDKTAPKVQGSWGFFFRKLYSLAYIRLRDLCAKLGVVEEDSMQKIWTVVEQVVMSDTELLRDRHLDQILLCSVYALCKLCAIEKTFHDITQAYRNQPQSESHVYRSVLLSSATSSVEKGAGSNASEERGDIIQFYNKVYITTIRPFLLKFRINDNLPVNPLLSPLPHTSRPSSLQSPKPLKLSAGSDCKFFLSTYKNPVVSNGVSAKTIRIHQSPAKDIADINRMVQLKSESLGRGKRALDLDDDGASLHMPKRLEKFKKLFATDQNQRGETVSIVGKPPMQ